MRDVLCECEYFRACLSGTVDDEQKGFDCTGQNGVWRNLQAFIKVLEKR